MKIFCPFIILKFRKIILFTFIGMFTCYAGISIYSTIFEQDKIAIDQYNFEQLERVKSIIESSSYNSKKFYSLKEFNALYGVNIVPIKNCYFVSSSNGAESYIFGFKLESMLYKIIHRTEYFAYPRYSMPYEPLCYGSIQDISLLSREAKGCDDRNKNYFGSIISRPCEK